MCPNLGWFVRSLIVKGRACWTVSGYLQGLHSFNLESLMSGVSWWVNCVAFSLEWRLFHYIVNISHLVGVVVLKKNSNILLYMTFEREPGPCISLQYGFSLLLPCLYISSLISNCLNLPFETQRRSWMFNEAYFLQRRDWGHRKYFGLKSPTGFYVVSISN